MASYNIIQTPRTDFVSSFNSNASQMIGDWAQRRLALQEQEKLRAAEEEKRNKYISALEAQGMEEESAYIDDSGNIRSHYKKPSAPKELFDTDPQKAIKQSMFSDDKAREIGIRLGIQETPGEDYTQKVRSALAEKFAPGFSSGDIQKDLLGLPPNPPATKEMANKLPDDFIQEVSDLSDKYADDQDGFVKQLEILGRTKYINNDAVQKKISKLVSLNMKVNKKSKGSEEEEALKAFEEADKASRTRVPPPETALTPMQRFFTSKPVDSIFKMIGR